MYTKHLCDPISYKLAVACRIDAQRNAVGRRVGLEMRVNVQHLFNSHVVIRVGNRHRLPQPIEHLEVNRRQEWVVIVTQRVEAQGVVWRDPIPVEKCQSVDSVARAVLVDKD